MRKALGLLGEGQRHRPEAERSEPTHRMGDRFNGGLHRRRFVQDGDIPVTVLRRDQGHELPAHRGAPPRHRPPAAGCSAPRLRWQPRLRPARRLNGRLADVQALAHDLQTKIGHAELAKNEAVDALRRERDVSVQLRTELPWVAGAARAGIGAVACGGAGVGILAGPIGRRTSCTQVNGKGAADGRRPHETRLNGWCARCPKKPRPRRRDGLKRSAGPHLEPEVAVVPARRSRVVEQPAASPNR